MGAEGEAGPVVARLFYFVGAGIVVTAAINKWLAIERKSLQNQMIKEDKILLEKQSSSVPQPTP